MVIRRMIPVMIDRVMRQDDPGGDRQDDVAG
jgi:hypothetical protein